MLPAVSRYQMQSRNLDGDSSVCDDNVLWLEVRNQLSLLRPYHKIQRDFIHVDDGRLVRVRLRGVALTQAKRNEENEDYNMRRQRRKELGDSHAGRPLCPGF